MPGYRFIVLAAAMLMMVVSIGLGASAGMANCAPQQPFSVSDHADHGADASAGCQASDCQDVDHRDMDCQDCCLGLSCVSSGVVLQDAMGMTKRLPSGQPQAISDDHLYGRSIAPETGPPKLPA